MSTPVQIAEAKAEAEKAYSDVGMLRPPAGHPQEGVYDFALACKAVQREAFERGWLAHASAHPQGTQQAPVAWMTSDGRVANADTHSRMNDSAREVYNTPLFAHPKRNTDALVEYAQHKWNCGEGRRPIDERLPCTCGLEALLKNFKDTHSK